MKKSCGYSLAELLIVLSMLTIATTAVAPAMGQMIHSRERTQALNQMITLLGYSRSAAVFHGHQTLLCTGSATCLGTPNWTSGLIVFHDINRNQQRDPDEPLLRHEQLPKGYNWYWSSFRDLDHIAFQTDGAARAANGTLTLCKEGVRNIR